MRSPSLELLRVLSLLVGVHFAAAATSSAGSCGGECTVEAPIPWVTSWTSIALPTTVTDKVILIVDEENHTTKTVTSRVTLPASAVVVKQPPTNSEGIAIATYSRVGQGIITLTYPSATINWASAYHLTGSVSTTINGKGVCVANTDIAWPTDETSKLTQPPLATPTGGDKYGLFFTTDVKMNGYPSGWEAMLKSREVAWQSCARVANAPAGAQGQVLVLTETEISTLPKAKGAKTSAPTTTTASQSGPIAAVTGGPKRTSTSVVTEEAIPTGTSEGLGGYIATGMGGVNGVSSPSPSVQQATGGAGRILLSGSALGGLAASLFWVIF
ncbi:hypothetical protein EJ06DRAFT_531522 [Trichodelitschia bisporula]|uniref:Uncharacterized protein n=1 Tax=Trichodelitschia bisporula TaxID=703511 RepID=A0A6G1HT72_9PEZI|nr:hypothetical protein EJ06DRAFT_531522 [Trichodelitschia bisporula]